jgi:hypothetical protein
VLAPAEAEALRLLDALRTLAEGGDAGTGPAVARIEGAWRAQPEALRRSVHRFGSELLAAPAAWTRAMDRLKELDGATRAFVLAELEVVCDRLASAHGQDAEFLARLARFRRLHVGERF